MPCGTVPRCPTSRRDRGAASGRPRRRSSTCSHSRRSTPTSTARATRPSGPARACSAARSRRRRCAPRPRPSATTARRTRCTATSCAPARLDRPTLLEVDRDRDGRSFSSRHVNAVQQGEVIFSAPGVVPRRRARAPTTRCRSSPPTPAIPRRRPVRERGGHNVLLDVRMAPGRRRPRVRRHRFWAQAPRRDARMTRSHVRACSRICPTSAGRSGRSTPPTATRGRVSTTRSGCSARSTRTTGCSSICSRSRWRPRAACSPARSTIGRGRSRAYFAQESLLRKTPLSEAATAVSPGRPSGERGEALDALDGERRDRLAEVRPTGRRQDRPPSASACRSARWRPPPCSG